MYMKAMPVTRAGGRSTRRLRIPSARQRGGGGDGEEGRVPYGHVADEQSTSIQL